MYSIIVVVTELALTRAIVDVGLSVGISVAVSVSSNKIRVVVILTKNVV